MMQMIVSTNLFTLCVDQRIIMPRTCFFVYAHERLYDILSQRKREIGNAGDNRILDFLP